MAVQQRGSATRRSQDVNASSMAPLSSHPNTPVTSSAPTEISATTPTGGGGGGGGGGNAATPRLAGPATSQKRLRSDNFRSDTDGETVKRSRTRQASDFRADVFATDRAVKPLSRPSQDLVASPIANGESEYIAALETPLAQLAAISTEEHQCISDLRAALSKTNRVLHLQRENEETAKQKLLDYRAHLQIKLADTEHQLQACEERLALNSKKIEKEVELQGILDAMSTLEGRPAVASNLSLDTGNSATIRLGPQQS